MCRKNHIEDPVEVATILNESGECTRLSDPGFIVVFRKMECIWEADRCMPFSLDGEKGLSDLRLKVRDLLSFIGNCRVFVAESASGALFFELEKAGLSMYELSGKPDEFLDHILKDEEMRIGSPPAQEDGDLPIPKELTPGNYVISIKDIQVVTPHLSSKQVLQRFVRDGNFASLEIVCDHLPPWIEIDAENLGMILETDCSGSCEVLVRLTKTSQMNS
ncbi:Fe-only nitrogenase accessory AnfO family protein [Methanocalculus sp.]|uniref:Fe-only nitrogenase accessory AnfO family protein n=1 Tax=Methanocalculus sp. TaxID=2004547 RepID=UPI002725A94D|nr:Fe-only nitrogenase accessory AnfO family protein [Methanocalculus sp.]MDO8841205.1 Fe-only nitrogenase accessory AnfO family protein [Methanocalculus sp.]